MFGREDPAVVRTLAAQHALIESDATVRSAQRRYEANPHDTEARDHYMKALDRAGKTVEADRLHYAPIAHHGQRLADAHNAWIRTDSPSTRAQWHRASTDALDHTMELVRERNPSRFGEHNRRSGEDHSEALHQIARHVPRSSFPEGEEGDRRHRLAIMAVHKFTNRDLEDRSRSTSRGGAYGTAVGGTFHEGPEIYSGTGDTFFGHDAVRSLHHHGYGDRHDMEVRQHPRSSVMTQIQVTPKKRK